MNRREIENQKLWFWAIVMLACVVGLVVLWRNGDAATARAHLLPLACSIVQISVLSRMMAAFFAYANPLRRQMLILPHRTSALSRKWFTGQTTSLRVTFGSLLFLTLAMLACGVDVATAVTHGLWQAAVVLLSTHVVIGVVSRAARWGWTVTIVFWAGVVMSFFGLALAVEPSTAMFIQPVAYGLLVIPDGLLDRFGALPAFLVAAGTLLAALYFRRANWRRIRRISRAFRNLPDRESVEVANLNYGRGEVVVEKILRSSLPWTPARMAEQIAIHRTIATPWSSLEDGQWNRWRRMALGASAAFVGAMAMLQGLNWVNGIDRATAFALGAIWIHVPMIFAISRTAPLLETRLLSTGDLFRMAWSGWQRDFGWTLVLVVPPAVGLAILTRNPVGIAIQVVTGLLIGWLIRTGWIWGLRYRGEGTNFANAYYVMVFSLMGLFVGNGILTNMFPWLAWPWWVCGVIPLTLGVGVWLAGWDRLVLRFRRRGRMPF